jgi:hypothetical protein
VADDRVAAAVAELYGADPDAFTERRKALVAAAREDGDKRSAAAITALRKPTRAAWLVNQLARADPDAPARLAALAGELRAAQRAKDGPRLRELSAARGSLLDALTDRALAAAGTPDPPPSLRADVTATLTAAMADPETAAAFAAGALTKAAQWSGFGYADLGAGGDSSADGGRSPAAASAPPPVDIATRRSRRARAAADSRTDAAPLVAPADRTSAQAAARRAAQEQSRLAAQEQRLAEEQRLAAAAAERAARAREKFEDAERTVAQASAAAAEAVSAEDRLEAEVRDLEGRLTKARADLADARRRARHAEAAEHRARQGLDRLPPP